VLVSGIGKTPQTVLEQSGMRVVVMEGLVGEGIEAVYLQKEIPKAMLRPPRRCGMGTSCGGTGTGCG
jgi:nitrogen fixation protein NifB